MATLKITLTPRQIGKTFNRSIMDKLTDCSPMPYGKHEGTKMANVPAAYLLYLDENNMASDAVQEYIDANRDVLESEVPKTDSIS